MSRVVRFDSFGGPDRLRIEQVDVPRLRREELRVRVSAVGLNPMDWMVLADSRLAAAFGITAPAGFGHDFAGVVDAVTDTDNSGFAVGDRVFGSVASRAAADYLVLGPRDVVHHTPDNVPDTVASALGVAGLTASAALDAVHVGAGDTLLIGGAAGGVGVLAGQLARLAGARVIGTAAPTTAGFLKRLGVEPVAYGPDLAARLRASNVVVTAALDLFGSDSVHAALELGVSPARIAAIAAGANLPVGVRRTGAADANPAVLLAVADAVAAGTITVPIAATIPLEQVRDAVQLQALGHVHGKIVVTT